MDNIRAAQLFLSYGSPPATYLNLQRCYTDATLMADLELCLRKLGSS